MPPDQRLIPLFAAEEQQRLRALDVAFARFLAELDAQADGAWLLLAALLSRRVADGHLCLDLSLWQPLAEEQAWPAPWREAVANVLDEQRVPAWIGAGSDTTPLVLEGTRLYLRRYWNHERQVAEAIRARLAQAHAAPAHLREQLARLFPGEASPDWPRIACALAARGAFTVITGGPGTGKTTTVVRLLGLLQTLRLRAGERPLRIRLAAPTGKAAARLQASIQGQLAQLDVDEAARAVIPAQVDTLHRLLGARPDTRRFRHDAAHPLPLDVLVIDEASMVDLEMMSAVLAALPPSARLVLLGDKDQLSSVEAGAVLGDLCRRAEAGHYGQDTAEWLRGVSGDDVGAWTAADAQALDQQVVMLRHSHRFGADSGIGRLAQAVNAGDMSALRALLAAPRPDIAWMAHAAGQGDLAELVLHGGDERFAADDQAPQGYRHYLELLRRERPASDAGEAAHEDWAHRVLDAFGRFQLLCALRRGDYGTEGLNRQIEDILGRARLIDPVHVWYEGRPVLVTRNDYNLGLMNGDVGVALMMPGEDGVPRLRVAFAAAGPSEGPDGARVRFVLPSRLGELETVYAMTVHKSQGSEFDSTALVLPAQDSGILTRELLYTGITRARRRFMLVSGEKLVEIAVQRLTLRHSGLRERLVAP
ncbi:exodeoxyribonuclease V subunit alpha [Dyella sp. LX-66]|uniref:exodeoxyribonuclease V subunit alpha n=1 Tax=unclassified Dyella TaxID=2634549 RepID=UPI001BE067DE|nr:MULTISPECIES: exodeoxyribonuclease V subunit alpha [unclassified Dyella]MBT2118134.1 exodeoxyribonuclease V subunit alpha [Dyella sp. LX-1]MBT2138840.1 exodeoxyribonuclease V subunit alpha [Dyella sp. LX-66]